MQANRTVESADTSTREDATTVWPHRESRGSRCLLSTIRPQRVLPLLFHSTKVHWHCATQLFVFKGEATSAPKLEGVTSNSTGHFTIKHMNRSGCLRRVCAISFRCRASLNVWHLQCVNTYLWCLINESPWISSLIHTSISSQGSKTWIVSAFTVRFVSNMDSAVLHGSRVAPGYHPHRLAWDKQHSFACLCEWTEKDIFWLMSNSEMKRSQAHLKRLPPSQAKRISLLLTLVQN